MSGFPIAGTVEPVRRSGRALLAALCLGGCAAEKVGAPVLDTAGVYEQLAAACNGRPIPPLAGPPSESGVAPSPASRGAGPQPRPVVAAALLSCAEAKDDAPRLVPTAAAASLARLTAQPALGEIAEGAPRPLMLRYPPVGDELRRADATTLATMVGHALARSDLRLRLTVGRGGLGNAFEQIIVAKNRARRIKEMLPPGLVTSVSFDPELPDDALRLEYVAADE
jgi:hypothetical protein